MGYVKRALLLRRLGRKLTGKIWSKQSTKRPPKNQHGPGNLCLKRWTAEQDAKGQTQPGASQHRTWGWVGCSVMGLVGGTVWWRESVSGLGSTWTRGEGSRSSTKEQSLLTSWFGAEKARQSTSSNHPSSLKDWWRHRCHLSSLCLTRQSRNIGFSLQIQGPACHWMQMICIETDGGSGNCWGLVCRG